LNKAPGSARRFVANKSRPSRMAVEQCLGIVRPTNLEPRKIDYGY